MDRIPIGLIQLLIFLSHANTVTNPAVLHFSLELASIKIQYQTDTRRPARKLATPHGLRQKSLMEPIDKNGTDISISQP
jgi:hypothetical protein